MTFDLGEALIKSVIIIGFLLTGFAYMTLFERRAVARLQGRLGPNRVGPAGLFQPIADGVKLVLKEQLTPRDAVLPLYWIAPAISGVVAFRDEPDLAPAAFQLEWADGRAAFDPAESFARIGEALNAALAAEAGHAETLNDGRP